MPRIISYLEEDIRKLTASKIKRGKVDIFISFDNYSKDGNDIRINTELAKIYIDNLKKLADEENNYLISSLMDDYIKEFYKSIWMINQVME